VFLPNWSTFLKVCAALCVGTVLAGMCYFIPIYFSTGMSVIDDRIVGGTLKEESIDLTALLRTNSFNPVTQKLFYLEDLPEAPYFRYSHYFGPATFVLLFASVVYAIRIRTTLSVSALYLLLVGIILFLGERLFVFGYDTGVLLPFYFLHLFSYGNIIRKSTYFFHLIVFSATILTTLFLAYMPKNNRGLLVAVFVVVVLLENIVAFDRPYHEVPNRHALYQHVEGTVLGLPNTNFSTNTFLLDISRYDVVKDNVSLFRYPDLFIVESETKKRTITGQAAPTGLVKVEGNQVYFGGNCLLDALVFQEQETCDVPRAAAEIKAMGITSIILYKNYVTDFFFNCDQTCTFYEDTEAILSANSDTFVSIYEDGEGIVYTIR
jgi:hypothetical protein